MHVVPRRATYLFSYLDGSTGDSVRSIQRKLCQFQHIGAKEIQIVLVWDITKWEQVRSPEEKKPNASKPFETSYDQRLELMHTCRLTGLEMPILTIHFFEKKGVL